MAEKEVTEIFCRNWKPNKSNNLNKVLYDFIAERIKALIYINFYKLK